MKKSLQALMLALAVLLPVAMSAASSAPVKRSVAAQESKRILKHQSLPKLFMPGAKMETAQMRVPGKPDGLIDIADATSLIDYVLNGTWPWETLAKPKTKYVIDISPATVRDLINKSASM